MTQPILLANLNYSFQLILSGVCPFRQSSGPISYTFSARINGCHHASFIQNKYRKMCYVLFFITLDIHSNLNQAKLIRTFAQNSQQLQVDCVNCGWVRVWLVGRQAGYIIQINTGNGGGGGHNCYMPFETCELQSVICIYIMLFFFLFFLTKRMDNHGQNNNRQLLLIVKNRPLFVVPSRMIEMCSRFSFVAVLLAVVPDCS